MSTKRGVIIAEVRISFLLFWWKINASLICRNENLTDLFFYLMNRKLRGEGKVSVRVTRRENWITYLATVFDCCLDGRSLLSSSTNIAITVEYINSNGPLRVNQVVYILTSEIVSRGVLVSVSPVETRSVLCWKSPQCSRNNKSLLERRSWRQQSIRAGAPESLNDFGSRTKGVTALLISSPKSRRRKSDHLPSVNGQV